MSWSLRLHLDKLAHYAPARRGPVVPSPRHPAGRRRPCPPPLRTVRVHIDGSHRRDRWEYRADAGGYVLAGLPSLDWRGQPAGVSLDTINALWPIRPETLRRVVDPAKAEADRRASRYRAAR